MNWIKQNWFKLLIIVIVLITIFLYFSNEQREERKTKSQQTQAELNKSPEQQSLSSERQEEPESKINQPEKLSEKSLLTKIQCKEMGEKAYNDLVEKLGSYLVFNPEYSYNESLDTCLYAGGFFGSDKADYMEMFVKDTVSNKTILIYAATKKNEEFIRIDGFSNTKSIPDFNQKKDILLGE